MEAALTILETYGLGSLALIATGALSVVVDRHVRADRHLHGQLLDGQKRLEENVENVRLAGEIHSENAVTARKAIHEDVGVVRDRISRLEGRFDAHTDKA